MQFGIILAEEHDATLKKYGLDDKSQLKTLGLAIVLVFAFAFGIIFTILVLKSHECGKGASYYGQAEKPAQTRVYGERNAEWEADYYRTLWIVNTILGN